LGEKERDRGSDGSGNRLCKGQKKNQEKREHKMEKKSTVTYELIRKLKKTMGEF